MGATTCVPRNACWAERLPDHSAVGAIKRALVSVAHHSDAPFSWLPKHPARLVIVITAAAGLYMDLAIPSPPTHVGSLPGW
jgi:hypothetical protein